MVDNESLVLLGYSFGGFLVSRTAAFEHRLASVVCVDGLFSVFDAFLQSFSPALKTLFYDGNKTAVDEILHKVMHKNTQLRWGVEQGCWAFCTDSPFEFLTRTRNMTMETIAADIQCPVLVCEAEEDHFFAGQPELLAKALGNRATYLKMTTIDSAQEHCHVGACDFAASKIMDWIGDVIG
jgi:pimeloyl-ACP methyl ester carboxylesterase